MQPPSLDFVLICLPTIAPRLPPGCIERALDGIRSRLDHALVALWDESDTGKIACQQTAIAKGRIGRVIVIPFSIFPIPQPDLRSHLWFRGLSLDLPIFEADPPTLQEWTRWIGAYPEISTHRVVELIPPDPVDQPCLERLAALAYWIGLHRPCRIRRPQAADHDHPDGNNRDYLPFSEAPYRIPTDSGDGGVNAHGSLSCRNGTVQPWMWLSHEPLADWLMGRFLQATNSHPISTFASPQNEVLQQVFRDLASRQHALLPKAYEGSLDDIRPNSMGSAKLVYDEQGNVPWDRIWTSFCDLAMAGGPPHRGTLLTAPSMEEIKMRLDEYATVVSEIRRGILLASRLPTRESESIGWVGVCCHDEEMAAWMLRAIIAENILVRREGSVIYLPAAPGFRIDKEIKNVITAVAKTTHYWLGHLKIRQPPKPL